MARSEARVSVDVWSPESDFTDLTPDAQWMYFLLLSQQDLAHTGVLALRPRRWSRCARGVTTEMVERRLEELAAARYVVIDEDTEELLIRSLIRRDRIYRQPNVLRAAADQLGLVVSDRIRRALAIECARVADEKMPDASIDILAEMRAALPHVSAGDKGSGNLPGSPSGNPHGNPTDEASDNPSESVPGERGEVTAVRSDSPYPVPQSPVPRTPYPGTTSLASLASSSARADKPRDRRGTRIPADFAPTTDMIGWAREHTPAVGAKETEAFIDYWRGKPGRAGVKLDWIATWRNWMRRAQTDAETRNGNARASPTGKIQYNGLLLNPKTVEDLEGRQRMAALDAAENAAQQAIEGRPPS